MPIDEAARATALVLANEYDGEKAAILQHRLEKAERHVAEQIARIEELDRHGLTGDAIIARQLLETLEASKSALRMMLDERERAAADRG